MGESRRWRAAMGRVAIACLGLFLSGLVLGAGSPAASAQEKVSDQRPPLPLPPPPTIQDPQLAPPPQAPRMLHSWDEALALIRAQSPDYLATVDNVLRAEAQTRVALAGVLPIINAQVSWTHQFETTQTGLAPPITTYPLQNVWAAGGTLGWQILNAQAYYAIGTASRGADAARLDLAERRRAIAESIVGSILRTLAGERVAELNRVGLRSALERLSLAETRVRLKSGTMLDIDRAEQDVAQARELVIQGDELLLQAREGLGLVLGSGVAIAPPGDMDLNEFERSVAATCRLNADVEDRADVEAAKMRVVVADRLIDNVWLEFLPSIGIQSQLAWGSQVLYPPNTTWSIGPVLSIPIFEGGARYGNLRDARAAADQARQALTAIRLNAIVNIIQADREVGVTLARRDVAQRQRDLAYRVDQRTREGYLHGLGTSLDLVISAQNLRQADIKLALLQYDHWQARVLATLAKAECNY